jgi:CubicO group peptidase (beta-lactamase class C family)
MLVVGGRALFVSPLASSLGCLQACHPSETVPQVQGIPSPRDGYDARHMLEMIDRWVDDGTVGSAAAAVVGPGANVVEERFAGAGERSLFALASVTKPIVALAALVAVEEGAL